MKLPDITLTANLLQVNGEPRLVFFKGSVYPVLSPEWQAIQESYVRTMFPTPVSAEWHLLKTQTSTNR